MKKHAIHVLVFFFGCPGLSGQAPQFTVFDTLELEEVTVSSMVPLNDEAMAGHYQVSRLSGMDEINERLGGVSVIGRGAYAREPLLNSFSAGQINVTIDGMKMFGACTDRMDPVTSYVEPVNLKSITLNHGSNGSINGSTVGGSFDMSLQTPVPGEISLEGGVTYESSPNGKAGFLNINYGRGKWAYRVSGVYKNHSSYTDGTGAIVPHSQYEKTNLYQSLSYTPAGGHTLTFDWLIDDARDVGYPALPMDVGVARGRIYSAEYESAGRILNIRKFRARVYGNTVFHLMDDSRRDSLYFVENTRTGGTDSVYMKMDMPGWSSTYGAYAEGYLSWSGKHTLFFKLEDYYNGSKAEMTMHMNNLSNPGEPPMYAETWPGHGRNVAGLYLKDNYEINSAASLGIDLRIDRSSSRIFSEQGKNQFLILGYDAGGTYFKLIKSVNLSMGYAPFRYLKLKAGSGYGERLPTLSEQFGFYLYNALDGYDYIGNPEIRTEKSVDVWANAAYLDPEFKITWESYVHFLKDYILGVSRPDFQALNLYASGVKQYVNIENAFLMASNVQFLWKPLQTLEVFSVTKYNYGELSSGRPLPLIPPLKTLMSLTFRRSVWHLRGETEYSASQNRINEDFGEIPSSSFALFHLRSGYDFRFQDWTLHLDAGIENIFNKAYSEHLDWGQYRRPGRNFYLGISVAY